MGRVRLTNEIIQKYGKPREAWPDVQFPNIETIKDQKKQALLMKKIKIYNSRKAAFDAYFDGIPIKDIKYENEKGEPQHLSYAEINRWMKRCLETTATGNIYGYTGLIPYYHIEPYKRTKSCKDEKNTSGQSGIFNKFLKLHPEIDDMIKQKYLAGGTSEIKTKGTKGIDIYQEMMRMCADMNLYNEYPLNRTA